MIDIRKLKELVRLMVEHDLSEVDLRDSEEQVTLRRGAPGSSGLHTLAHAPIHVAAPVVTAPPSASPASTGAASSPPATGTGDAGLVPITSPMVGTFYASADPSSPPFVTVGDAISPQRVVCLIEAMKIFNEIRPDLTGRIEKVMVKNGQAVEFGQTLFLVKPE